jgi:hypothetical protein
MGPVEARAAFEIASDLERATSNGPPHAEPAIHVDVPGSKLSVDLEGRVLGVDVLPDREISVNVNGPVLGTERSALEIAEDVGRAPEPSLARYHQPTIDLDAGVRVDPQVPRERPEPHAGLLRDMGIGHRESIRSDLL